MAVRKTTPATKAAKPTPTRRVAAKPLTAPSTDISTLLDEIHARGKALTADIDKLMARFG